MELVAVVVTLWLAVALLHDGYALATVAFELVISAGCRKGRNLNKYLIKRYQLVYCSFSARPSRRRSPVACCTSAWCRTCTSIHRSGIHMLRILKNFKIKSQDVRNLCESVLLGAYHSRIHRRNRHSRLCHCIWHQPACNSHLGICSRFLCKL